MSGKNIRTYSGHLLNLENPDHSHVSIKCISHSLSKIGRFNGHTITIEGYSVAEHSVMVSDIIWNMGGGRDAMLCGLMHDAHEAYVGDVISPLKNLPELKAGFEIIDRRFRDLITKTFNLKWDNRIVRLVAEADEIALATEMRDITSKNDYSGKLGPRTKRIKHTCSAAQAQLEFMRAYDVLTRER